MPVKRTVTERLIMLSRRNPDTGCVEWIGKSRNRPCGYGRLKINGVPKLAHRVAYETFIGPIPPGMKVLHTCDNPGCIAVHHLVLGTQKANVADCAAKGRRAVRQGEAVNTAKLTIEQVRAIKASTAPTKALAIQFNVSYMAIWKIRRGDAWKGV